MISEPQVHRRGTRYREVRSRSLSVRGRHAVFAERSKYPDVSHLRPKTRGECAGVARPCPFVSCRYHLFVEVTRAGSLKVNFPDLEPAEIPETCALDVADRGGASLEEVAERMNLVKERVRQIETIAVEKLRRRLPLFSHPNDFEHSPGVLWDDPDGESTAPEDATVVSAGAPHPWRRRRAGGKTCSSCGGAGHNRRTCARTPKGEERQDG